ncbi:sorting nexin-24 isoform X2 [Lethenteron reissneri]|uniref:sorting nexin-24 isoform X2 n=1 Tax=Lethenteron reissneri TaxID=7753 RepID=UPI002AB78441|nr:sorting nexin-24 isoform X2 [Lethenteron reissneri]
MEALVRVTSFRQEGADAERAASSSSSPYTVFKVEVTMNGRKHFLEKRYSEFHALHKQLKKVIKTPEFPPKHVRNWVPKVLEQRRQGLEYYLQLLGRSRFRRAEALPPAGAGLLPGSVRAAGHVGGPPQHRGGRCSAGPVPAAHTAEVMVTPRPSFSSASASCLSIRHWSACVSAPSLTRHSLWASERARALTL